ncbi:MAG: DUF4395 domain-containing protein [Pseudomonadota bacterium]
MNKIIQFGENVEGYDVPVLNEREVRASAGILFLLLLISLFQINYEENFFMVKYVVTLFLTDFTIRVLVNPKFSPTLILGRWFVRNQAPEYVGAAQKKFAWKIGLLFSSIIFLHLVVLNGFSIVSGLICMACLIFLYFETAFGICIACKFYNWFHKDKALYCPGNACDVSAHQEIQTVSRLQITIFAGFVLYAMLVVVLLNDNFSASPNDLFSSLSSSSAETVTF